MFVCLFVSNKKKRLGQNFFWNLTWPQGRFIDEQFFKYLPPTSSIFIELKIHEISFFKFANLFLVLFYSVYKEKTFTIEMAQYSKTWRTIRTRRYMLIHEDQEEQEDICLYIKNKIINYNTWRTRRYILIHKEQEYIF